MILGLTKENLATCFCIKIRVKLPPVECNWALVTVLWGPLVF